MTFPDEPLAHSLFDQMIEAMRKAESLSFVSHCEWETGGDVGGGICRVWMKKPHYVIDRQGKVVDAWFVSEKDHTRAKAALEKVGIK